MKTSDARCSINEPLSFPTSAPYPPPPSFPWLPAVAPVRPHLRQGREADLWALGCCVYQFMAGFTPFDSPSAYLSFQRVKKGIFR